MVNGHAAVILFFVLSGFVLSLPLLSGKALNYRVFLVKRIFRIYFPYLIAIVFSIVLATVLSKGGIDELSDWFNRSWNTPVTAGLILEHLLLVPNGHFDVYNNVIWSLVHEMRISLIYPIIYIIIVKFNWKICISISVLFSLIAGLNEYFGFQISNAYFTTYYDTFHYTAMFIMGGLLVKHLNDLLQFYKKLSVFAKWALFIVAFCFYNFSGIGSMIITKMGLPFGRIFGDYIITLGSLIIILISIGSTQIAKFLLAKPIKFLGKISYSLYLYHLVVLFSLIYLLYNITSLWVIYVLTIVVSILVATASYHFIEMPFIKLGKKVSNKFIEKSTIKKRIA